MSSNRNRQVKTSPDNFAIDRRKAELCGCGLRSTMVYLRQIAFFGFAFMTVIWSLNAIAAETRNSNDHWINTWTAGPMPPWAGPIPAGFFDQTVRQVVRISLGGDKVRVRLSNEFGFRPVEVGAAHVAVAGDVGAIQADTDRTLTFNGKPTVTLLPGAPVLSDPVKLKVAPLTHLAISLYFEQRAEVRTYHLEAAQTAYISSLGNFVSAEKMPAGDTATSRFFLTAVMVNAPADARVVVAFGDSITDGARSTPDTDNRWPDHLAERISQAPEHAAVAVVNEGIGGNRVLSDGMGIKALARFDRDVLSQPSVSHVVIMEGINDIGWPETFLTPPEEPVTADKIIAGYQQLIDRAHLQIRAEYDAGDHLHPNDAGYKAMGDSVDLRLLDGH
jgi:lysophospholipase L1-like esterase